MERGGARRKRVGSSQKDYEGGNAKLGTREKFSGVREVGGGKQLVPGWWVCGGGGGGGGDENGGRGDEKR